MPRLLGLGLLTLIVMGLLVAIGQRRGTAQTSAISADVAVSQALLSAKDDGLFGGFVNQPTMVQGQFMTFERARQMILGQSLNADEEMVKWRDYPVWLIVLEGKFVEHVPSAPNIPAKDVLHSQMALIIDANTAELMEKYLISPQQRLSTASLPTLSIPLGTIPPAPTQAPISTTAPLPTRP